MRGLKGNKGEKVRRKLCPAPENWKFFFFLSILHHTDLFLSFLNPSQGEDGFPGFKGDMGIKGDRVRTTNPRPPYSTQNVKRCRLG